MRILIILLTLCVSASGAWAQTTLKPGDTLAISVLQDPKLDRQVIVDSGGQIAFPLAGHIRAEGLSRAGTGKHPQIEAAEELQGRKPRRHGGAGQPHHPRGRPQAESLRHRRGSAGPARMWSGSGPP